MAVQRIALNKQIRIHSSAAVDVVIFNMSKDRVRVGIIIRHATAIATHRHTIKIKKTIAKTQRYAFFLP